MFCRNVFIYFSDDAIRTVARMLAARMPADGYLFIAASESLMRLGTGFVMDEVGSAFAYVQNPDPTPEADAAILAARRTDLRAELSRLPDILFTSTIHFRAV